MLGNRDAAEPVNPSSSRERDRAAVFAALKDATRREVLRHLDPDEGWVALGDLAERVADDDPRDADRVAAALHHNHLPKLAECGLVEYDHLDHRVAVADRASAGPYLEPFED